jgi:hypothetical protein
LEPGLVSFLSSAGARGNVVDGIYDALNRGPLSAPTRRALDQELAHYDDPQRLVRVFRTEQAISMAITAESANHIKPVWLRYVFGWPMRSHFLSALDSYDRHLALAARPWHEVRNEFGAANSRSNDARALGDLLSPALGAVHQAYARTLTMMRGLRIFNALTEYREMHGREASGLEELALPREATIDPYSGTPLKLKHVEEGWLIYSVMDNAADDGGDYRQMKDAGLAPPGPRRAN